HVLSFIDIKSVKPLHVAVDTGNGVGGIFIEKLFAKLPCNIIPLYFEPDGNFPNHLPNPIEPENTFELRRVVLERGCELGAAFDGDADRVFLMDEKGNIINGGILAALVARTLLQKYPGESIVYSIIASRVFPETIEKYGGKPIKSRVGHAFIKPIMREHNAIFGGEHSGHFYFRENYYADSGIIAFLIALELISKENKKLSELVAEVDHYVRTEEINFRVKNIPKKIEELEKTFISKGYNVDKLDGITVACENFWFNLRPSNTEPLIRMNLEAENNVTLERIKKELFELMKD
ncbi:MAG: phosphomannomutase/phosphoglucomutase, partial [bacterium]